MALHSVGPSWLLLLCSLANLLAISGELISSDGLIHVITRNSKSTTCFTFNDHHRVIIAPCETENSKFQFTQIPITNLDEWFQIKLIHNDASSQSLCWVVTEEVEYIDLRECDTTNSKQQFKLVRDDPRGRNGLQVMGDSLCVQPTSMEIDQDNVRLMPCSSIKNEINTLKFYDFDDLADMRSSLELLNILTENSNEIKYPDLAQGQSYFRLQAIYPLEGFDLSGWYVEDLYGNAPIEDDEIRERSIVMINEGGEYPKVFHLNLDSGEFQISAQVSPSEHVELLFRGSSDNREMTRLDKHYFPGYTIEENSLKNFDFCDKDPCDTLVPHFHQCVDNNNGFRCLCSPVINDRGSICQKPNLCKVNPCRNNGDCEHVTDTEIVCNCDPNNIFFGERCNDCKEVDPLTLLVAAGKGFNSECILFDTCLKDEPIGTEHCTACDNENAPWQCSECISLYHIDFVDYSCKPNVCNCYNGVAGDLTTCYTHGGSLCISCDAGYRLDAGICKTNICTCENGNPQSPCTVNGSNECDSCYSGYFMNNGECVTVCTCSNGTPANPCPISGEDCASCDSGYSINAYSSCEAQCTCDNGIVTSTCGVPGNYCASCNTGYHINGDQCTLNQCNCDNGTPTSTCDVNNMESCQVCDNGFVINGLSCTPDVNNQCGGLRLPVDPSIPIRSSPSGEYGNDMDCGWHIQVDAVVVIEWQVTSFAIEASGACSYDALLVNYNAFDSAEKHCTGKQGFSLNTWYESQLGNILKIHFSSDGSVTKSGFELSWRVKAVCFCDDGTALSPCQTSGHHCSACDIAYHLEGDQCAGNTCVCANGSPHTGSACQYVNDLHTSCNLCDAGYHIEGSACVVNQCTCTHGSFTIGTSCPTHAQQGCDVCHSGFVKEGILCNPEIVYPPHQNPNSCGSAIYQTDPSNNIRSSASGSYSNSMNCDWIIGTGDETTIVEWQITSLNIESHSTCSYDSVSVDNLSKSCNDNVQFSLNTWYESSGGHVLNLNFRSDGSVTESGFVLTWRLKGGCCDNGVDMPGATCGSHSTPSATQLTLRDPSFEPNGSHSSFPVQNAIDGKVNSNSDSDLAHSTSSHDTFEVSLDMAFITTVKIYPRTNCCLRMLPSILYLNDNIGEECPLTTNGGSSNPYIFTCNRLGNKISFNNYQDQFINLIEIQAFGAVGVCESCDAGYTLTLEGCVESNPGESGPVTDGLKLHYDGDSWDAGLNKWLDKTSNAANTPHNAGTITTSTTNGFTYISGTRSTEITIGWWESSPSYTFIHLTKYAASGSQGRIWNGQNQNWLSGHWNGNSGVYFHSAWAETPANHHGRDWVLTVDTKAKIWHNNRVINAVTSSTAEPTHVGIGTHQNYGGEVSDWDCALVMVYNRILSDTEVASVRSWIHGKYPVFTL